MTRRTFFQTIGAVALSSSVTGARRVPDSAWSADFDPDAWTEARQIVASGALGPVIWGQVSAPGDAVTGDRELRRVLSVMGVEGQPRRMVRLASGPRPGDAAGVTTIVAVQSGPSVFMAPGPALETTIRGTRARLHIRNGQVRVVPTA